MRPGLMRTVSALGGVSLVLVALAAVLPPVAAGTMLFAPNPDGGHALGAFFVSRILPALRFTVLQAVLSAILAVLVGLPGAFLAARRDFPGRRILLSLSGVPLCVPPVVIALSFVLFYGRSGVLNSVLMAIFALDAPPVTFLYSLAGVVLAHGLYNFPVVLRTVSRAWERLPADREEAALLLGAGHFRVFRTIIMPALAGPLLSSALLVFLYCFFSFVIVLMFGTIGGTTLEVELYQAARNVTNLRGAALIAVVETLCAIGFVLLHAFTRRYFSHTRGMNVLRSRKPLCGIREIGPGTGYLVLLAVFFIGPLCMIVVRSLTVTSGGQYTGATGFALSGWASLFTLPSFYSALAATFAVGCATAFLATAAALAFALYEEKRGSESTFMRTLPLLPLAVSSVVLGFGWTMLVPEGSVAVLVVAQAAVSWPFTWTQIRASLDRIPKEIPQAALLLSPRASDVSFRVLVPLSRRGILSGAGFAFAISAGDASLPLILSLPEFENLALLLFRLSGSYRFTEASACAVLLALITGVVFFLQDSEKERSS